MSTHIRSQVRTALAAALVGLDGVGNRVSASRLARISPAELPCITVGTPGERIDQIGISKPYLYQRLISVDIDAYVAAEPFEDVADALAAAIETRLAADGILHGIVQSPPVLTDTELAIDDTVSPPMAMVRLSYQVSAITEADQPAPATPPTP